MDNPFNWEDFEFENEETLMAKLSPQAALGIALSALGALSSVGHVFFPEWKDIAVSTLFKYMNSEGNNKIGRDFIEIGALATALTHRLMEEQGVEVREVGTLDEVDMEASGTPDGVLRQVADSYPGEEYTLEALAALKLRLYGTDGEMPSGKISEDEVRKLEDHFNMKEAEDDKPE